MLVTIRDLNRLIDAKKREKHTTYNKIVEMCMAKVTRYAREQQYNCMFDMPEILLGEPLYKLGTALEYVVDRLRHDAGMLVKVLPPRSLYISWSYEELNAHRKRLITPPPLRPIDYHISQPSLAHSPHGNALAGQLFPDIRFHPMTIMQNDMVARMQRPITSAPPANAPAPATFKKRDTYPLHLPPPPPPHNHNHNPNHNHNHNHHALHAQHPQSIPPTVTDWLAPPQSSRKVLRRETSATASSAAFDGFDDATNTFASASIEHKPSGKIILNLE